MGRDYDCKMEPYKQNDWLPFSNGPVNSHFHTPLCCEHRQKETGNQKNQKKAQLGSTMW